MHQRQGNIQGIEASEREKTGIKGLKIKYNRVFGYYIEVTKSNSSLVPGNLYPQADPGQLRAVYHTGVQGTGEPGADRERKDDGAWRMRFSTRCGNCLLTDRRASSRRRTLIKAGFSLFACEVVVTEHYVCPETDLDGRLEIKDGRHPVVEQMLNGASLCRMIPI